ncbi:hypothetical protein WME98_03085 [Sorangium sp. So ce296]|uniref:hypothetical protein n=1 Tax=Sorangium sp. So ce296 TaxID=3133296 RepID=UPI003F5F1D2B
MAHRGRVFMSLESLQSLQSHKSHILQFKHHPRVEPAGDKDTVFPIGGRARFMLRGRHASGRRGSTMCRSASGGSTGRTGKGA